MRVCESFDKGHNKKSFNIYLFASSFLLHFFFLLSAGPDRY